MKTNTNMQPIETISNRLIEQMFLWCATEPEIIRFEHMKQKGRRYGNGAATSLASRVVRREFANLMHYKTGLEYR